MRTKTDVHRWLKLQGITILLIAMLWGLAGWHAAASALLGGIACLAPNFLFAQIFFSSPHANGKKIISIFYLGELGKLASSVLLLLLFLCFMKVQIVALFVGFLGANLGIWLGPLATTSNTMVMKAND